MTSDLATSAKSDVSVARWVAMIAGLLGFVMAVATPLPPNSFLLDRKSVV